MLIIRLTRIGKKKKAIFRIVVAEKSAPVKGRYLEILGQYRPQDQKNPISVKKERILYWLEKGAKLSDTVNNLLCDLKILPASARIKKTVTKKRKKKKETKPEKPKIIEAPKRQEAESIMEEGLKEKIEEEKEKEEVKERIEEAAEDKEQPETDQKTPESPKSESPKPEEPKKT